MKNVIKLTTNESMKIHLLI